MVIAANPYKYGYAQANQIQGLDKAQEEWWYDFSDSVPGINLNKALFYSKEKLSPNVQSARVAILDSDFNIYSEYIKSFIWTQNKEIPDNDLDEDGNGYVDDVCGWNFLAREKNGKATAFTQTESAQILSTYDSTYIDSQFNLGKVPFRFTDVKAMYEEDMAEAKKDLEENKKIIEGYDSTIKRIKELIQDSIVDLKAINLDTIQDNSLKQWISYIVKLEETGDTYNSIKDDIYRLKKIIEKSYSLARIVRPGSPSQSSKNVNNGTPALATNLKYLQHGTKIFGIVASILESSPLEATQSIIPLAITGIGNFTDDNFYKAIKYAVDNGTKVINLSQSKEFTMTEEILDEAMKYAEKKDVLIIKSAGNDYMDRDQKVNYPNDIDSKGEELFGNLLIIGASADKIDSTLKRKSSNYGKKNVDLFAPGYKIKVLQTDDTFKHSSGTSMAAAIVTGVATIVRSYYPNLSAAQVKKILMDSGTSYNVDVEIKNDEGEVVKTLPFSDLSKSGKIVNAYNALLMAEEVSREGKQETGDQTIDKVRKVKKIRK